MVLYLRAVNVKKHIPNFITCLNLLMGCFAVIALFNSDPLSASYFVIAAAIFDFFDGFAARILKVSSPIGAELDSLADMVTFGLVPGLMLLHYLTSSIGVDVSMQAISRHPVLLIPFLTPVFSALRLAKFNVDTRQSDSFRGLPTPASAMWVVSIPLMIEFMPFHMWWEPENVIVDKWFIIGTAVGLSFLMVSDMPLLALKFKSFGWQGTELRLVLILVSAVLLIILRPLAIPIILSLYVIFSLIHNLFLSKNEVQSRD